MSTKKLSPSQTRMLKNIAAGRSPTYGLTGRSAHGAAHATLASLNRLGLVQGIEVTEAGRQRVGGDAS